MQELRMELHHVEVDEESDKVLRVRKKQTLNVLFRTLRFFKLLFEHLVNIGKHVIDR